MATALDDSLGQGKLVLGVGLAAAGFSSAVTAPLAAALTARGLFSNGADDPRWSQSSIRFRAVWAGVLIAGLAVGLSGVRPIAAILAAQAFNGLLLPAVAVFLLLAVNDRALVGADGLNRPLGNGALIVTVAVCALLGATGLAKAVTGAIGLERPAPQTLLWVGIAGTVLVLIPALLRLPKLRRG